MSESAGPGSPPSLARVLAGLALDYLRWSQLVPMVMAWAFLLLMVGAMLLVNFQQQSFQLIDSAARLYERVAGPIDVEPDGARERRAGPGTAEPRPTGAPAEEAAPDGRASDGAAPGRLPAGEAAVGQPPAGTITFTEADLEPLVLKFWGLLALAGWLLGMAWRLLFGPPPRLTLKRKLAIAGAACLACTVLFLVAYFFGSETFEDPFWQWMTLFIVVPLIVWCVSAYALAVSTLVDGLKRRLYGGPEASVS